VTAFTGQTPTPPIATFIRRATHQPVTLKQAQRERCLNLKELQATVADLHPIVKEKLMGNRERSRKAASRGQLPNFSEGDFVLVAREEFFAGEKLSLRWRGPRRVVKCLSDYVYKIEDLRNGSCSDIHSSRLKFYTDKDLNTKAIMPHVVHSEHGMEVSRLLHFVEEKDLLFVKVRWKGLSPDDDTLEPIKSVFEDVPVMFRRFLLRKSTPHKLQQRVHRELGL